LPILAMGGCALLGTPFEPAIATPEMAAEALASRWTESAGIRIHYVAAGLERGPAVAFVHGSPGTWEAWRGFLKDPDLRRRARLLALDRPGFGGSARGRAEPSLERQAAAIAAVLDAERVSGAIVVGHSLGGPIAARLALDRPALARGLALVAPSIDPELEGRRWFNVAGSWRVVQWFLPVDWTTSNREIWWLRRELELLAPGLESLAAPTIVIQGGRDDLVDPANADYVERRFRSAPLEIRRLPDAGHFVVWEDPAPIRRAIEELLERPL
jgi:pimeloyl-ACP methyl ester carboxylesterase